jgi:hypothetical protein
MATVFWDRKGVLMVEFMQHGTKITSQVYCETLKKLLRAIHNERHEMLTFSVVHLAYSCLHSSTAAAFKLGVV